MDVKGSENVHHKYSKDELLTISKLEISLKKPDVLKDELFNENKRWSPELGFKAMLLESRHANGNSIIKADIKNEVKIDSSLPPLRPQLGGWGSGCIGMKPIPITQSNPAPRPEVDIQVRPNPRPAKIIIPPRPQEPRHPENSQLGRSWRDKSRFELEADRHDRRPPWNEKPTVNTRRDFNNRYDQDPRYPSNRHNGHNYRDRDEDLNADDLWDDPSEDPFEFGGLPDDLRGEPKSSSEMSNKSHSPVDVERPPSGSAPNQTNIPRSESPDMESSLMRELLKIFDDSEVTEIPVVTNPGGSRILPLISQFPKPSFNDQGNYGSDYFPNNDQHHQSLHQGRSSDSGRNFPLSGQPQSDGGAVGNDLLQILQKAKINVNNFVPSNSGVPAMNVAQAKSLAEIEGGMARAQGAGLGRSSPLERHHERPSENHAFNKLLEMMNSSRNRTENNQQIPPQFQQQRVSSYELERMHEEKKRMEQQQLAQEARRDSVGSGGTPHSFVPIQVMRQARSHFQEQLPRPLVGRTSSIGGNPGYAGQPHPFGPRMGLSDAEIRQLAQLRPSIGVPRSGVERNSPVNLLQQSQQPQFMMPPQLRGPYAGVHMNPGQQHFNPQIGAGHRPSQLPVGAPGQHRGMPGPNHQYQDRVQAQQQQQLASQSQGPMNLQQLQMLNQHLHSLPPQQLSEMSRGMTSEQLSQMLLRASHQ